jgi:prepilin-type N-terminal cleavage/methylation domain-containing protein
MADVYQGAAGLSGLLLRVSQPSIFSQKIEGYMPVRSIRGFTLIELKVVVVILGSFSVSSSPRS